MMNRFRSFVVTKVRYFHLLGLGGPYLKSHYFFNLGKKMENWLTKLIKRIRLTTSNNRK